MKSCIVKLIVKEGESQRLWRIRSVSDFSFALMALLWKNEGPRKRQWAAEMRGPEMDIESLNLLPVNRKARKMLEEAGENPDDGGLYCIQLALWGLDDGGLEADDDVVETVRAMVAWGPVRLMNFFIIVPPGEGFDPPRWEEAESPVELAQVLLNEVEAKVRIHFPWYGSVY
jgi:hypothetical protein